MSSHGLTVKVRGVLCFPGTGLPLLSLQHPVIEKEPLWNLALMNFRVQQLGPLVNYAPCSWRSASLIFYGGPTLGSVLNVFKWGQRCYLAGERKSAYWWLPFYRNHRKLLYSFILDSISNPFLSEPKPIWHYTSFPKNPLSFYNTL